MCSGSYYSFTNDQLYFVRDIWDVTIDSDINTPSTENVELSFDFINFETYILSPS